MNGGRVNAVRSSLPLSSVGRCPREVQKTAELPETLKTPPTGIKITSAKKSPFRFYLNYFP